MPSSEIERTQILTEVRATRDALSNIPARLDKIENKDRITRWLVSAIAFIAIIGGFVILGRDNQANDRQSKRFDDFAQCQAQYNQANAVISQVRTNLNVRYNNNTEHLIIQVGQIVLAKKGSLNAAFAAYDKELAAIEKVRAANPIPVYPDCYGKYIKQSGPAAPQIPK